MLRKGRRTCEITGLAETFRCSIIDIATNSVIIQAVGDTDKNNAFLRVLEPYGIMDISRTGETAMNWGEASGSREQ